MSERLSLDQVGGKPPELGSSELAELAELYARVFAGEPWNEYTTCSDSGVFFGKDTQPGDICPDAGCSTILQPAYPLANTTTYINGELARSDSALLLLRDQDRDDALVGFSWGFSYDKPEDFAVAKYKTPQMQIAIGGLLRSLNLGDNGLWYLSESGIEDDIRYRGKGISREFHTRRLEIARSLGLDAIQRTSAYGNMYRTSKRTMAQIMGTETAHSATTNRLEITGQIVNDLPDTEIEGRVLFAQKK